MIKKIFSHSHPPPPQGETFEKPSLTVPNQALSVEEILKRYVRGQDVQTFQPTYNDSEDLVGYENLSRIEAAEFAKENAQKVFAIQKDLQRQEQRKKEKLSQSVEQSEEQ